MRVRSEECKLAIRQETAFAMRPVHQAIHRAFKGNRDGMLALGVRPLGRPPKRLKAAGESRHAQGDSDVIRRYAHTLELVAAPECMTRLQFVVWREQVKT